MYGMLLGMVIGALGGYFYYGGPDVKKHIPEVTENVQGEVSRYGGVIKEKAREAGHAIAEATSVNSGRHLFQVLASAPPKAS